MMMEADRFLDSDKFHASFAGLRSHAEHPQVLSVPLHAGGCPCERSARATRAQIPCCLRSRSRERDRPGDRGALVIDETERPIPGDVLGERWSVSGPGTSCRAKD